MDLVQRKDLGARAGGRHHGLEHCPVIASSKAVSQRGSTALESARHGDSKCLPSRLARVLDNVGNPHFPVLVQLTFLKVSLLA